MDISNSLAVHSDAMLESFHPENNAGTIIEPQIHYLKRYRSFSLDGPNADAATIEAAWRIYRAISPLLPKPDTSEYRWLWFKAERGHIDDWMTFEEYQAEQREYEDGPNSTKDDWLKDWRWYYPNPKYWHLLEVAREKEWLSIAIDGDRVLQVGPEKPEIWEDAYRTEAFLLLGNMVSEVVKSISKGSYGKSLIEHLPHSFRWGFIRRKDFWQATNNEGRSRCGNMMKEEALLLAEKLRKQTQPEYMPKLKELSMRQYFESLKEAYRAAGMENDKDSWRGFQAEDPRAWYCRFGDARDEGVFEIDQESPAALRAFMKSDHFFNHTFEVLAGRGCVRVFLRPVLSDEDTWYLSMHGHFTWHADDMARMWNRLNEMGVPTYMHNSEGLANALLGDDWVLIAPTHVSVDYMSGTEKYGRKVGYATHLWEGYEEALIEAAEWLELDMPKLEDSELEGTHALTEKGHA